VSSFEYSVTLLCNALRTNDAERRIQEMKDYFRVPESGATVEEGDDQSMTEALAVVYLALGRAYAILNEAKESIEACNKSIGCARTSKRALKSGTSFSSKHFSSRCCSCWSLFWIMWANSLLPSSYCLRIRKTWLEGKQRRGGSPIRVEFCVSGTSVVGDRNRSEDHQRYL
jgi:hypothetical protein